MVSVADITAKVVTSKPAVPQIYAYTTPTIPSHDGWTKIGYTEQPIDKRLWQQSHTVDADAHLEWFDNALYVGGEPFRDTDFHAYLRRLGVGQLKDPESGKWLEWLHIEPEPAELKFNKFRRNHGIIEGEEASSTSSYQLRAEQERAVELALEYARSHERGEFLWNAKPRFGKTLATYDFVKRYLADKPANSSHNVLIVTNRPAIANSWYDDYAKFLGLESGYRFVSEVDALKDKTAHPLCLTRKEYNKAILGDGPTGCIEFVSLQDLKGSIHFGGYYDKLGEVAKLKWDVLVIDEAHEGVDTLKTDVAFDHIDRRFTLHLSGTPFKALASEKFAEDAIYNWTYADEQQAKADWNEPDVDSPYAVLPRLNLFTYQMSDIVADKARQGVTLEDGEQVEYAFDLNEFFKTSERGYFVHNDDVDRFLDALTQNTKYPFSTPQLRNELKHTLWMLDRVASAKALARKLKAHPLFKDYEIVLAAGDGKLNGGDDTADMDEKSTEKAFDRVRKAIATHDKTITLSVGQLTVGVTVPEWTAVLMLSNMRSPALYMQAAFRAQNPCLFPDPQTHGFRRKENAYVFDFDPARTLDIYEKFANDLDTGTAGGHGDTDERKAHIRKLLNFFPVIGEDEDGRMVELDAERVLSIPSKIRSREVVRRGFMSDFLFYGISNIFHAPAEVLDAIGKLTPYKAPSQDLGVTKDTAQELSLNDDGDVELDDQTVVGLSADVFGDKLYDVAKQLDDAVEQAKETSEDNGGADDKAFLDSVAAAFDVAATKPVLDAASQHYGDALKPTETKRLERKLKADIDLERDKRVGDYAIKRNKIEHEREQKLQAAQTDAQAARIDQEALEAHKANRQELVDSLKDSGAKLVEQAGRTIVKEVETSKRETVKQGIEDKVRDHLRGFSRTIPSFLMAYGDEGTTLANLDTIIPPDVFKEVTSITVDQFRLLRDGGDVTGNDGAPQHFDGHLFDPVVFDDSVKEFIALRGRLANYFDEHQKEDIFDYVPPQKTNQIFTPRRIVVEMVDAFEQENPGCFDDPNHTFADLYMKSGLYLTEIIKRLYRSDGMKQAYPADDERLKHILEHQVFGIAPSQIIYEIATHYILGFNDEIGRGADTNFVMADSAELAREGKLAEYVENTFGNKL